MSLLLLLMRKSSHLLRWIDAVLVSVCRGEGVSTPCRTALSQNYWLIIKQHDNTDIQSRRVRKTARSPPRLTGGRRWLGWSQQDNYCHNEECKHHHHHCNRNPSRALTQHTHTYTHTLYFSHIYIHEQKDVLPDWTETDAAVVPKSLNLTLAWWVSEDLMGLIGTDNKERERGYYVCHQFFFFFLISKANRKYFYSCILTVFWKALLS